MTTNDTIPPGFTKQPDGTLAPTASYTLLMRRAHEHSPMLREARQAALEVLDRLSSELRLVPNLNAQVEREDVTLRVAFPARWTSGHHTKAGVTVDASQLKVWQVQWVQVDDHERRAIEQNPRELTVSFEPERKTFAYKGEDGQWRPDAAAGLMALILQRVPFPAVPNGSNG